MPAMPQQLAWRFPDPRADERIARLVNVIACAFEEHGSAEVLGVPGD